MTRRDPPIVSECGLTSADFALHSGGSHPPTAFPQPRNADTAIDTRSSLCVMTGLCAGATKFKFSEHTEGVCRVASHVAGVSTATARCSSCFYGYAFTEFELNVHAQSPRTAFARSYDVSFRIRRLYKSHILSRKDPQRPSMAAFFAHRQAESSTRVTRHDGLPVK